MLSKLKATKLLGSGSFGTVFQVKEKETKKQLAAKFAFKDEDSDFEYDTLRDCVGQGHIIQIVKGTIGKLEREEIKELLNCIEDVNLREETKKNLEEIRDNVSIIFMELMDCSLSDYLRSHQFKSTEAIKIGATSIFEGIEFLRKNGIVHRDIKPSNVLVGNGTLKLADLGGGCYHEGEGPKKHSTKVGTKRYRAPEISSGFYCPKVDVYSGTLTLFKMMTAGIHDMDNNEDKAFNLLIRDRKLMDNFPSKFIKWHGLLRLGTTKSPQKRIRSDAMIDRISRM